MIGGLIYFIESGESSIRLECMKKLTRGGHGYSRCCGGRTILNVPSTAIIDISNNNI